MAWFDEDWPYRVKITVHSSKVDETVSNFPVYVDLSDLPAGFFSNVKSDGGDIRVTQADGETQQAREIVRINTGSSTGEMHLKGSSVSSSTDTDFYIYYGNSGASEPAASSTYGSENVWDANYIAVLHLDQDPSGTPPQMLDSTSNDNHGTSIGTMTSGDLVDVKVGKGLDLDGSDDALNWSDVTDLLDGEKATFEMWVNYDSVSNEAFPAKFSTREGSDIIEVWEEAGKLYYRMGNGTVSINYTYTFNTGEDHHFAFTQDYQTGSNNKIIQDGVTKASYTSAFPAASLSGSFKMGQMSNYAGSNIDGKMDEFRISDIVRSGGWISTGYNNQNDTSTFYTPGDEESLSAGSYPQVMFI
jgi:hypothetical protein